MKNKKMIALIAIVLVAALMVGVYVMTRPQAVEGQKSVHIVIAYQDGTMRSEVYETDAEYLSELLLEKELVTGYESEEFGFTIEGVDGIVLDWAKDNAYWALYVGHTDPASENGVTYEYATTSAAGIVLEDGAHYKLAYESF